MIFVKQFTKPSYLLIELCKWYGWKNPNSCLFSCFFASQKTCNGYEKSYMFSLLVPWQWYCENSQYNGHGRFAFGCGLFSFYFDYNHLKSIVFSE